VAPHRILLKPPIPPDGTLLIEDEQAHHALRVKRLTPGEQIELLDGSGGLADARFVDAGGSGRRPSIRIEVLRCRRVEPPAPSVHLACPAPEGNRLSRMVDALCQVGTAEWSPLVAARSQRPPARGDRLERRVIESCRQCGRAWFMRIGEARTLTDALKAPGVVLADAGGELYRATGANEISLLIGPEGGFTDAELDAARVAGARIVSFGPHAMRIETAAPVAAAIVLDTERRC